MDTWIQKLTSLFGGGKAFSQREVREYFEQIARSFAEVKRRDVEKSSGRGGEIYVKYSPWPTTAWSSSSSSRTARSWCPASFPL